MDSVQFFVEICKMNLLKLILQGSHDAREAKFCRKVFTPPAVKLRTDTKMIAPSAAKLRTKIKKVFLPLLSRLLRAFS